MTDEKSDFANLPTPDLVMRINSAYETILAEDRNTFQKAVPIGQMLIELRPRVAKHGEWRDWVKANCPKVSAETVRL